MTIDINKLRKASKAVYLAVEKPVADELSQMLSNAADELEIDLMQAIDDAACDLPDGYSINLGVENGAAWVSLKRPDGQTEDIDSADMTLSEQVKQAAAIATEEAEKGGF